MRESRSAGSPRRALVVVGAVFGVAMLSAGVARADDSVQLRSRLGDFCLDTPSGNYMTPTVINPCNGSASERWNLTPAGQLESVAFPGQCLSTPGESWAAHMQPCVDWITQKWNIQPDGLITSPGTLNGCHTVLGGPGPGTMVSTRLCDAGAADQQWDSVP